MKFIYLLFIYSNTHHDPNSVLFPPLLPHKTHPKSPLHRLEPRVQSHIYITGVLLLAGLHVHLTLNYFSFS